MRSVKVMGSSCRVAWEETRERAGYWPSYDARSGATSSGCRHTSHVVVVRQSATGVIEPHEGQRWRAKRSVGSLSSSRCREGSVGSSKGNSILI
jgi:hypothetical protein